MTSISGDLAHERLHLRRNVARVEVAADAIAQAARLADVDDFTLGIRIR